MAKWLNRIAGLIMPDTLAQADTAPPASPPRMILGGNAAPQLCMIADEWPGFMEWAPAVHTHRRVTQLKADGINAMYLEGRVIGGREGGPLDCALHCQPGLERLERHIGCPMVFFGEYVAHDGFNATLSEHKVGKGSGTFWLYDAIPHGAWVTGREYEVPIEKRLTLLREYMLAADTGLFVGFLDFWLLDGPETLAKAREVWAAGFEGLVSKEPGSGYARRRDGRWLKVKERLSAPCAVIDTVMKAGRLHKVIVRGPEPSGSKPLTLCGGWSQADECALVAAAGLIVAEVEFELTVGVTRSIRGATWKGIIA